MAWTIDYVLLHVDEDTPHERRSRTIDGLTFHGGSGAVTVINRRFRRHEAIECLLSENIIVREQGSDVIQLVAPSGDERRFYFSTFAFESTWYAMAWDGKPEKQLTEQEKRWRATRKLLFEIASVAFVCTRGILDIACAACEGWTGKPTDRLR